jgi:hypothetical protein
MPGQRLYLARIDFLNRTAVQNRVIREPLINPSFRRMPESIALNSLDPGMRRDDEKRINQKFLSLLGRIERRLSAIPVRRRGQPSL